MNPDRMRTAVMEQDEKTARDSAHALRDMHYAVQIDMVFRSADPEKSGRVTAARWDRMGRVIYRHTGKFQKYIPGWVTGQDPVEREKSDEPSAS